MRKLFVFLYVIFLMSRCVRTYTYKKPSVFTIDFVIFLVPRNETSARLLRTVLVREKLNHYGNMAQRGLSSCFSRKFINYNNITGLVKNSQQIYSGVTKRGSVDIVLEHENVKYDLCSVSVFILILRSRISS